MKIPKKQANLRNGLINDLLEKCLFYSTRNETNQEALIEEFIDLDSIATNIRKIETGLFVQHHREDHLKEFITWLKSNGCFNESLDIINFDASLREYGLITKKATLEDELVLKIPKRLMMTTETALKDTSLKSAVLEDPLLKSMPNVLLAFHLMIEYCQKDSFWKPYILFLPSVYSTPLYYTKEDLLLLKGSHVLLESVKLVRNIYRQYAYFWKKMSSKSSSINKIKELKGLYSLDLYRWAISTVMTRQNQIPTSASHGPDQSTTGLIPLWDLCNHQDGKFSTDYDPVESNLLCYAMKDFSINEEITIFYGKRTNAEFLINNGFVPANNQHDFMSIRMGLSKVDPLFELRSKLCLMMNLPTSGYLPLHHKTLGLDENLLNFVKIFLMDKATLEKLLKSDQLITNASFNDLPDDLALKAFNFISIRCQILLKSYPNLDKEQNNLTPCGHHIIQLIECEKNILSSHVINAIQSTNGK
ncbi:histone-lysine N-methyltransferase setd3 [Tetranychus urticae]|uniref:protein-histidine N-methyltransferase n=1 Tax=Tetranychus urticae TaxID=32264 RepID=T1K981_TETUR|nr:histone-lysine N-methyltransferase setd3 [Tetranychus urticae]